MFISPVEPGTYSLYSPVSSVFGLSDAEVQSVHIPITTPTIPIISPFGYIQEVPAVNSVTAKIINSTLKNANDNLEQALPYNMPYSPSYGALYPDTRNAIYFYGSSKPYFELTNFYSVPITIDGQTYLSTEHYYQSQKFLHHADIYNRILNAMSPKDAARIANEYIRLVNMDKWNDMKVDIMRRALYAKFMQHSNLRDLLLRTNQMMLIERNSMDRFWGDGGDGSGMNRLGELLMEIRRKLAYGISGGEKYKEKYAEYKAKYLASQK